ncbi:MAG: DUF4105 domain-containing protein [Rhodanobacter sp.]|jgi:hypothetical protein|nr:DUF4105 domain-containing protein [Rhodanobacter sp.]
MRVAEAAQRSHVRARRILSFALALCIWLAAVGACAQTDEPTATAAVADAPLISLLTIGPGEIFFERFGHNAIVVRGADGRPPAAYNYGIFDFDQQDFLLNFVRGRMLYRIAVDTLDEDLAMYREEGRAVVEQHLNLAPDQARVLAEFLAWNALPENAQYRYDYFLANCSTRVRDALDRALDGALHAQTEGRSRGYTYRLDALRLMAPEPWLMLAIDLGLGPFADQRIDVWQESFVPETLRDTATHVLITSADGHSVPLVADDHVIAQGRIEEPPALPPDLRWPFFGIGIALGALLFWLGTRHTAGIRIPLAIFASLFELFCGLGGLVLLFLWFGTEHRAAWRNENLLLLNPLCLLLIPAWLGMLRAHWRVRAFAARIAWIVVAGAAFGLFSKLLPWFVQVNFAWIVLFLPIHLALALTLTRDPMPRSRRTQ